ncbi:hypothetical protein [Microbulbifer salipaludis]|uniref:hypothetical protein n=1 Tax=Microbulbifer salipaludis TaxID=187980 RepID=UPI001A8EA171|nr:hypothetical protein [Microbulbifer salipaludis]
MLKDVIAQMRINNRHIKAKDVSNTAAIALITAMADLYPYLLVQRLDSHLGGENSSRAE